MERDTSGLESNIRATALEFRLRMAINAAIILLGFWAPWEGSYVNRVQLLGWLPAEVSRAGILPFSQAVPVVLGAAAAFSALGVLLRVWGTAYLGPATVTSMEMKSGAMVADGPYRFLRNPLYLGLWFMAAALAFLMPPTGALATMALSTVFLIRLTLGEEAFLSAQLGEPYQAYLRAVPRFVPLLRSRVPRGGGRPGWIRALAAELTPIGVFVAMAFVSWSYDRVLMGRVILIAFGLSIVVRALMPHDPDPAR
jgi:protein-S-isoprenylcysteine O-methyltransferase Ste14